MYRRYTASEPETKSENNFTGAARGVHSQNKREETGKKSASASNAKKTVRKSPAPKPSSGTKRKSPQTGRGQSGKSCNVKPDAGQTHSRAEHEREHEREREREYGHERERGETPRREEEKSGFKKSSIFKFIPESIYNPETKKVLGFLKAEDLLLIALILIFLDNDENDDPMLLYALIFILVSDWIDFSAIGKMLPF